MPPRTPCLLVLLCSLWACTPSSKTEPGAEVSIPTDDTAAPGSTDEGGADSAAPEDSGLPEHCDTAEPSPPTKSPKRGLAYDLLDEGDLGAISSEVSWWYNWYFQSNVAEGFEARHQMQFIPMLWGYNAESDYVALESWLLEHSDVNDILVMNEPNLVDQANMTPEMAVDYWLRAEQFQTEMFTTHGRTIRLVGPAMTWGTMVGYADPVVWLDAFYAAFNAAHGRDPIIDALAFHWYDYGLDDQLSRLESFAKPFWVTEMANWHTEEGWTIDTPEKQIETMADMVGICESRADVERYAWFIGRWAPDPHHTSIFSEGPGELTALGTAYLAQPW